jgi:putative transposase
VKIAGNAVAESFFISVKKKRKTKPHYKTLKRLYKTRDLVRADIFDYIEVFYNRTRRHGHLGGVSIEAFEQASREDRICPWFWERFISKELNTNFNNMRHAS